VGFHDIDEIEVLLTLTVSRDGRAFGDGGFTLRAYRAQPSLSRPLLRILYHPVARVGFGLDG